MPMCPKGFWGETWRGIRPLQISPQVVVRLKRLPEVKRCLSLAGELDLLIDIAAESLARLNQIRDEISNFPEVAETTTAVVLRQEI